MVAEVMQGAPCRFTDPAGFSVAHGGKDRHPFPVPLKIYDETIKVLKSAVQGGLRRGDQASAADPIDYPAAVPGAGAMAGAKIGRIHFAVRIDPKTLEPRGAMTPGVPELRLKLDKRRWLHLYQRRTRGLERRNDRYLCVVRI